MKLVIDASRANISERTGVEQYAFSVIQELKHIIPSDVEVIVYTREKLISEFSVLPANWRCKVLKWPPKMLWSQLRVVFALLHDRPDVFFVPSHVLPFFTPCRAIYTLHDVAFMYFPSVYTLRERWYQKLTVAFSTRRSSAVIVPSEQTKKDLIQFFGISEEKITVIFHGIDQSLYGKHLVSEDKAQEVLEKFHIVKPFFLSVGRLESKKNTARIVQAFGLFRERYPDYQLVLAGKPGFGFEEVGRAISQSAYASDIIVTGFVQTSDLSVIYAQARLFVFPSLYEGFGLPLLESALSETPIITSKDSCMEEVFDTSQAMFVDPKSVEDIAYAMEKLASDSVLSQSITSQAYAHTRGFTWSESAMKHWEVMKKIL